MDELTGLCTKLKNTDLPLEARIELSRKILGNSDCFLPNKNQVIVDWLFQELVNIRSSRGKKRATENGCEVQENETQLWKTLNEVLNDPASEQIVLRTKILPVLFKELDGLKSILGKSCPENEGLSKMTQDRVLYVLLCFQAVSKNPNMSLIFFNKLENLEQFVKGMLACFLGVLLRPDLHSSNFFEELVHLVVTVLHEYSTAQQQQVTQRKLFSNLCEKLLHLLLLVRAAIKNNKILLSKELWMDEIGSSVDGVITFGLFHKDIVSSYHPTAISCQESEPSLKKPKLVNPYSQLFDVLKKLTLDCQEGVIVEGIDVKPDLVSLSISSSLPFLLQNFLKTTDGDMKLDNAGKFSFFVELYELIPPTQEQVPEVSRIEILREMLKIVVDYDVYQIVEDNVNDRQIFKWFLSMVKNELLSQRFVDDTRFHCLDIILKLNHKIIEQSLEVVLAKCFVKPKQSSKAKIDLLCNLVQTYSKLQQMENLVTVMLKVFKTLGNKLGTIPADVLAKLSRSFEQCPFNQTLSILQRFLGEMKEKVQSIESTEQEDENTNFSIEGISNLFVTFLLNSSYNAAGTHGLDQKKVTKLKELVEDIKVAIIIPFIKAFPACTKALQKELGFSTLFLMYGLNSLVLFLQQHNVIPTSNDHFVKVLWDSTIDSYIPDETWGSLAILKKNRRLRFCMELLVTQGLRYLLLMSNFDQNEFNRMLNFLYNVQDLQTIPELFSVFWNLDPSCVNNTNYPVAHWSLLAQYAPLLIPFCSENQIQHFAEFMVRTLVQQDKQTTPDDSVMLYDVSESNLYQGELLSLSSLESAVVKQLWKMLGECIGHVVGDKLSGVFTWEMVEDRGSRIEDVDHEGTHEPEANVQSGTTHMNKAISLAQSIAKVMNAEGSRSGKERSKKVRRGDLSVVAHLLEVLQRLPSHQFKPSNQIHTILGLLACDVLMRKAAQSDHTGPDGQWLTIQLSCREIITTLLQGFLQQRQYSVWRVIDMSSFLRWLYHTILQEDRVATKCTLSCKFLNASKELLRFAVIVSLNSASHASLTAIDDFSQQLVASTSDTELENAVLEMIRCVDVLFIIVSACTDYMEQKGKNNSSLKTTRAIISNIVSLANFLKSILEEGSYSQPKEERRVELENGVMKLSGILTRAMSLIPDLSENQDSTDAFQRWLEIVSMLVTKVLGKMDNVGYILNGLEVNDEMTSYITILVDVFKGGSEQCDFVADELRTQILGKCLNILRKTRFSTGEAVQIGTPSSKRLSELQEAVLDLIKGLLEEDEGKNFISVLEGVLEWNFEEEDSEHASLKFLTSLSVFRDLLDTKVVKHNKKELHSITGKIMLSLLSRAAINNDILVVVLEITAALVSLGSGVFQPQDLSLVFQALAYNLEVTNLGLFSRIFMARFVILSWTLFYYPEYVYGAVHVFVPLVRELLHSLLTKAAEMSDSKTEMEEGSILLNCAQKMSRLYQEMASHKDVLSKYSIYFLADCVHVMSTQGVPGTIRDILVQGVHFLFDICDDDCLTKLHVYLPSNERVLFRSLKEDYMKHHKFKGNA